MDFTETPGSHRVVNRCPLPHRTTTLPPIPYPAFIKGTASAVTAKSTISSRLPRLRERSRRRASGPTSEEWIVTSAAAPVCRRSGSSRLPRSYPRTAAGGGCLLRLAGRLLSANGHASCTLLAPACPPATSAPAGRGLSQRLEHRRILPSAQILTTRRRRRRSQPHLAAFALVRAVLANLCLLLLAWVLLSLGGYLIGAWTLLPVAIVILLPMLLRSFRRRPTQPT